MDKLDCINTFIGVVEQGDFSKASRHLGITRDQVAKRICYLEALFDTVLFTRTTRNMNLTHAGEKFYQHSKAIMGEYEWALNDFIYDKEYPGGTLKINAPHSFLQSYLSELISNFMTLYPLIKIDLFLSDEFVEINEENFDLSLRMSAKKHTAPHSHLLNIYQRHFYATDTYFNKYGKPTELEQLKQHHLLLYSQKRSPNKITLFKNNTEESIFTNPLFTCNSGSFLLELCKNNQGIIYLPSFLLEKDKELGHITRCFEDYQSPELYVYAIISSKKKIPKTLELFLEHLKTNLPSSTAG